MRVTGLEEGMPRFKFDPLVPPGYPLSTRPQILHPPLPLPQHSRRVIPHVDKGGARGDFQIATFHFFPPPPFLHALGRNLPTFSVLFVPNSPIKKRGARGDFLILSLSTPRHTQTTIQRRDLHFQHPTRKKPTSKKLVVIHQSAYR